MKILIVDDNKNLVRIMSLIFETYLDDIDIETASDGYTALEKCIETRPDLITLDIDIPGLDGYQVCENIRNNEQTKHIPIIVITALDRKYAEPKILKLGANGFLSKPFETKDMLDLIKKLVC